MNATRTARLAGALYLAMMPFAMFSLYVRMSAIPGATHAETVANISESWSLFGAAIVTWLASQVISIFLVVQLHKLLKPVNPTQALMMLVLALVGVAITCANESHQFAVMVLLQGVTSADPDHQVAQVALQLAMHERGLAVAHIFWGLWLLPLGWLVFRSGFLPRWLGVLLLIAGAGYLFDFFTSTLFPFVGVTVTPFTFVGELLLPLWLLIRGVDVSRPMNQGAI
jgi:hypothetical protein